MGEQRLWWFRNEHYEDCVMENEKGKLEVQQKTNWETDASTCIFGDKDYYSYFGKKVY